MFDMGVNRNEARSTMLECRRAEYHAGGVRHGDLLQPSFRTRPWVRFVSVALSVTLACTMFDARGLESAFAANDPASPAVHQRNAEGDKNVSAPTETKDEAKTAETPKADQSESPESQAPAGESSNDAQSSNSQVEEPQNEKASSVDDAKTNADAMADGDVADSSEAPKDSADPEAGAAAKPEQEKEAEPELPAGLIDADQVLPQVTGGTADVSKRLDPSLFIANAPREESGAYYVNGARATMRLDLGAVESSLEEIGRAHV